MEEFVLVLFLKPQLLSGAQLVEHVARGLKDLDGGALLKIGLKRFSKLLSALLQMRLSSAATDSGYL